MRTHYFKRHQRDELWHYYKLLIDRDPPAREVINFLNPAPIVDFAEYDLLSPGGRIEYEALWEVGQQIDAGEYQAAYQRATVGAFDLYLNGRRQ